MKMRLQLVSNSSSSSYICTFGKIINFDKFDKFCTEKGVSYNVVLGWELATSPPWMYHQAPLFEFFEPLEDDFYKRMPKKKNLAEHAIKDTDSYYVLSGEMSYFNDELLCCEDIRLEDFSETQQILYTAGEKEGFESLESIFYAGDY
jgi:hypothetical protein